MSTNGLRSVLEAARAAERCSATALTVLASQNDPFRVDTPSGRRDGEWLAVHAERLGLGERRIHLRGLHYMLVSGEVLKPNGLPYMNTEADWVWMSERCGKAARWLGFIPFEQIVDARNGEPSVVVRKPRDLFSYVSVGVDVEVPDVDGLEPRVGISGFTGIQPYKIVFFGEKTSLQDVLGEVADTYGADLYLPAGEISDTLLHQMAYVGNEDGRRMVVLCFSDCDPAGWQMPISIARKLQAFKASLFPDLSFEVRRVGLTPDQVREYGLPSTPLKETEKRAGAWLRSMGVEQTEIDALAALNPELLREIATDAVAPFYDSTLNRRVAEARRQWLEQAQARLEEQIDQEKLERLRSDAAAKLEMLRDEIDAINEALRAETGDDFQLPEAVVPEPESNGGPDGSPLIDSAWSWVEQTVRLKSSKAYEA
jgi:hypothetical protein